ncbi:unnamed protein product, partial [Amoebophrya sp. A120]
SWPLGYFGAPKLRIRPNVLAFALPPLYSKFARPFLGVSHSCRAYPEGRPVWEAR